MRKIKWRRERQHKVSMSWEDKETMWEWPSSLCSTQTVKIRGFQTNPLKAVAFHCTTFMQRSTCCCSRTYNWFKPDRELPNVQICYNWRSVFYLLLTESNYIKLCAALRCLFTSVVPVNTDLATLSWDSRYSSDLHHPNSDKNRGLR